MILSDTKNQTDICLIKNSLKQARTDYSSNKSQTKIPNDIIGCHYLLII